MNKIFFYIFFLTWCFEGPAQDTLNRVNEQGHRYGYWKIPGEEKNGFGTNAVAEEGWYANGRKEGVWKTYFSNGKLKSVIPHNDGRPNGKFIVYTELGCIAEKGDWPGHYEGIYLEHVKDNGYHVFNYNENGKQQGEQFYYNEYGQLTEYLISSNGNRQYKLKFDTSGKVTYIYPTNADTVIIDEESLHPDFAKIFGCGLRPMPKPVIKYEGPYLVDKTPICVGEFRNGKLWNGKWYKYNENGVLVKVEIWKNGRYFADVPTDR